MNTLFYFFSLVWSSFLFIIPAFPTAFDFSPADDDLFSEEGAVSPDSSSLFDGIPTAENVDESELFLAESPSGCSSIPNPPSLRRGLISTRQSVEDRCITTYKSQSGSESPSSQNLDVDRLGVIENMQTYWCSEFVGWAFGMIPVCSVDDGNSITSEEELGDPALRQIMNPSGYRNLLDCFQSKHAMCKNLSCVLNHS